MISQQEMITLALECGATKAAIVTRDQIKVSEHFRAACEANHCGVYGKCWQCPPFIGEIGALIEQVRCYPQGLLYQTVSQIEDSYDIEGMQEAAREHARVTRNLQKQIKEVLQAEFLHLGSGGCNVCETCSKRNEEPCRFPELAMSSMEGYGIDVFSTTQKTELKYINGQNTVTYFGIVLFSE